MRGLGAHEVVDRNLWRESLGGRRFDLVFDASGKLPARVLRSLVRREGTAVTVNPGTDNPIIAARSRLLPGAAVRGFLVRPSGGDLVLLRGWIEEGSLRPVIQEVLPIQELERAHRVSEGGQVRGKLVLTLPSAPQATQHGA
ncbi:zinc-binding dehydrogenase [Arthrobacter sp. MSA 4-2]|uniref:zinc-binding dehydrogenase n=1 Tax=Arthrobacter sp. MSA 4-2 TaxID=2794349 RepID=UPI0035A85535